MDNNQMNGNNNNNNNNNNRNNKNGQMFLAFLLVSLVMLFIMSYVNSKMDQMSSEEITYSRFLKMVEEDKVESVEIGSSEIKITPKEEKKDTKVNNDQKDLLHRNRGKSGSVKDFGKTRCQYQRNDPG